MKESGYTPSKELAERAAPTEKREDRWMRGEVHDPRAYLLEGVAGPGPQQADGRLEPVEQAGVAAGTPPLAVDPVQGRFDAGGVEPTAHLVGLAGRAEVDLRIERYLMKAGVLRPDTVLAARATEAEAERHLRLTTRLTTAVATTTTLDPAASAPPGSAVAGPAPLGPSGAAGAVGGPGGPGGGPGGGGVGGLLDAGVDGVKRPGRCEPGTCPGVDQAGTAGLRL